MQHLSILFLRSKIRALGGGSVKTQNPCLLACPPSSLALPSAHTRLPLPPWIFITIPMTGHAQGGRGGGPWRSHQSKEWDSSGTTFQKSESCFQFHEPGQVSQSESSWEAKWESRRETGWAPWHHSHPAVLVVMWAVLSCFLLTAGKLLMGRMNESLLWAL